MTARLPAGYAADWWVLANEDEIRRAMRAVLLGTNLVSVQTVDDYAEMLTRRLVDRLREQQRVVPARR